MKIAIILSGLTLAGCTTTQGGPTALPKDAYAGMWSTRSVSDVTACIVQKTDLHPDSMYRVEETKNNEIYQTQVVLINRDIPTDKAAQMALCLAG